MHPTRAGHALLLRLTVPAQPCPIPLGQIDCRSSGQVVVALARIAHPHARAPVLLKHRLSHLQLGIQHSDLGSLL
eukprot:1085419-Prymnesium_polylepis.2